MIRTSADNSSIGKPGLTSKVYTIPATQSTPCRSSHCPRFISCQYKYTIVYPHNKRTTRHVVLELMFKLQLNNKQKNPLFSNGGWRVKPSISVPVSHCKSGHSQNVVILSYEIGTQAVKDSHANQHQTEPNVVLFAVYVYRTHSQ